MLIVLIIAMLLYLQILIPSAKAANILVLDGLPSPSHQMWIRVLVNTVAANNKEHNITVVSLKKDESAPVNVHYILLEDVYDSIYDGSDVMDWVAANDAAVYDEIQQCTEFCVKSCNVSIQTNGFQQILNYPSSFKFDLVLYDYTCGPCLLGALFRFDHQPTIIGITASGILSQEISGNHDYSAYIPHFLLPYDSDMNFGQRLENFIVYQLWSIERKLRLYPQTNELLTKALKQALPKSLEDLERNIRLVLINADFAIDYPQPLPPSVIPVGGLQIREPKPLSEELEIFIRSSENGTILFSFGTNIQCDALPQTKRDAILNAFKEMPSYNFLWKCESKDLPLNPARNVLVQRFFPQNDILAHPKVKAFVTHAGLLSIHEATWYAVPMLGIPFIRDQRSNVKKIVKNGVAEQLNYADLTRETLRRKILSIVENPKYKEAIEIRSKHFRHQVQPPLERAIWWINQAIQQPNMDYLKSPVLELGYIRGNAYDILFVSIVVPLLSLISIIFLTCKLVACICCGGKRRRRNKKQ